MNVQKIKGETAETYFVDEEPGEMANLCLLIATLVGQVLLTDKKSQASQPANLYKVDGPSERQLAYVIAKVSEKGRLALGIVVIQKTTGKVEFLRSYKHGTYQGIGKTLLQAAIEYAEREKLKVSVDAEGNSHGFYYKLKFRSLEPAQNAQIKQELKAAKKENRLPNTRQYFTVCPHMILSDKGKAHWDRVIESSSLLKK